MKRRNWLTRCAARSNAARRPIVGAFLLIAMVTGPIACGDDGFSAPVELPSISGSFAVGHMAFTAVDTARGDRSLLVDVWYPVDAEDAPGVPFTEYPLGPGIGLASEIALEGPPVSRREGQPLLVFSHGYGGINTQSVELLEALASHGFIVVSPEHTGNAQSSLTDSFDEAAANRVPDVSFLIDTMIARNRDPQDEFYARLDELRAGVVGHSFGGMTAIGSVAGWAGADGDPRVAAIVPISAVIDAELQSDARSGPNAGFTAQQLATIDVPVMLIGGTEDINVFIENNEIAFEQLVSAPRVHQVDIVGANHTHFANVCSIGNLLIDLGIGQETWPAIGAQELLDPYAMTCSPTAFPIGEAMRLQSLYVVSFFQRHLLNEEAYGRYLTPQYADTEPSVELSVK